MKASDSAGEKFAEFRRLIGLDVRELQGLLSAWRPIGRYVLDATYQYFYCQTTMLPPTNGCWLP